MSHCVSVIIPDFNQAATVKVLAGRVRAVLGDVEIIVVGDSSADGSAEPIGPLGLRTEFYHAASMVDTVCCASRSIACCCDVATDWPDSGISVDVWLISTNCGGTGTFILCRSRDRRQKEQAMHARFEKRIEDGLDKIQASCEKRKHSAVKIASRKATSRFARSGIRKSTACWLTFWSAFWLTSCGRRSPSCAAAPTWEANHDACWMSWGELRVMDVVLPISEGVEIRRRCVCRPSEHQATLLHRLGLQLPRSLETTQA